MKKYYRFRPLTGISSFQFESAFDSAIDSGFPSPYGD